MKDDILKGLRNLEELLEQLPAPVGAGLGQRIRELRELLVEQRPPRLILVGRRGAGKSTLVNAIFDQPLASVGHVGRGTLEAGWYAYKSERGSMSVLDTRGVGESSHASAATTSDSALSGIVSECQAMPPDAVLFLIKAKEIESRLDEDIEDLVVVCTALRKSHGARLAIIGVANQCDELSPPGVRLEKPDDSERYAQKLEAVRVVERKLEDKLRAQQAVGEQLVRTLGVVSYVEWDTSGKVIDDLRWRIDELVRYVFQELPAQAQVEMARISRVKKVQRDLAKRVVYATAAVGAAVAAVPLPLADMGPITASQLAMVIAVGYIGGRELSPKAAAEFLVALGVNVGVGFVFREVARGLIKWAFPGGGSAVSAAVAYAATLGLGMAAIAYFIEGKSIAEAKREYGVTRQKAERDYQKPE